MIISNPSLDKLKEYQLNLDNYIKEMASFKEVKYLDLGVKVVRIINYSPEFTHLIEKQLTYVLKDNADKYDATLILWKENNVKDLYKIIAPEFNPKTNLRFRINMLTAKKTYDDLWIFDSVYSYTNPLVSVDTNQNIVNFYDRETETYYYGVENLEPEEFIKQGHIFVHIINKIVKSKTTNLVHGACIGMNNKGILFCARGQRGKSTLTVLSMLKGFEYVSDDYLTLDNQAGKLFASPIYSIITLSPRMYNELYSDLEGCRFVSNNARKDKYVVNIANLHNQFKSNYPIELCMFPEIVSDENPSILECDKEEKGRAIVQLIQSTVFQMQDINNQEVILKLFNMVKNHKFYKINLCNDIEKNTQFLKEFLENYQPQKIESQTALSNMLVDVTFDIANILDTKTGIIYTMNKFATNVYENLVNGVSKEALFEFFEQNKELSCLVKDLDIFINILKDLNLLENIKNNMSKPSINNDFLKEDNYKLSIIKYEQKQNLELI